MHRGDPTALLATPPIIAGSFPGGILRSRYELTPPRDDVDRLVPSDRWLVSHRPTQEPAAMAQRPKADDVEVELPPHEVAAGQEAQLRKGVAEMTEGAVAAATADAAASAERDSAAAGASPASSSSAAAAAAAHQQKAAEEARKVAVPEALAAADEEEIGPVPERWADLVKACEGKPYSLERLVPGANGDGGVFLGTLAAAAPSAAVSASAAAAIRIHLRQLGQPFGS